MINYVIAEVKKHLGVLPSSQCLQMFFSLFCSMCVSGIIIYSNVWKS